MSGRKLLPVLTCSAAKAGKEKLAGTREKIVGTAFAQDPVALARGVVEFKAKLGTRGIVNARMIPMLSRQVREKNGKIKR